MIDLDSTKVNGDPQPPDEINSIFAEAKTIISSLGISFAPGSIEQLAQSIQVSAMMGSYFADGGTPNTYVLSSVPGTRKNAPSYFAGMEVYFLPANTNTGSSTANVSGLGAETIKLADGSTNLSGGEIVAGVLTRLVYDGANFRLAAIDYSFDSNDFDVAGTSVSLKAGVSAKDWDYDSGWFTASVNTLYTKAHGVSLTFPGDILDYIVFWRVSSGGSYIMKALSFNNTNGEPRFSHDGTNIYAKANQFWGEYIDSAGTIQTAGNGELRILARKQV